MRIYLAAGYSRRAELLERAADLEVRGHAIVSTWIDGHHETRPGIDRDATPAEQAAWATEDVVDVLRADWVVSLTEGGRSRGGRHVEFGIGVAAGKHLVVVGPREHVFHCLPAVAVFPDWPAFLAALDQPGGNGA